MKHFKQLFVLTLMLLVSICHVWGADVLDVLTASDFTATNTTYTDFSDVSKTSDAVYAGNSGKTSSGGIQLRSKNSNSGIVSTTTGGTVKSVTITVESGTNTIDVYGSNTAYSSASDLYGNNKGTKVGSLSATGTVTFTDSYAYVGIRSNNGALYLTSVTITWDDGQGGDDPGTCTGEKLTTPVVTATPRDGQVTLSWGAVANASGYQLKWGDNWEDAITETSVTKSSLDNGTAYSYQVKAIGDGTSYCDSDPTASASVTPNKSYTVTFVKDGATISTPSVVEGAQPEAPTVTELCTGSASATFIGWTQTPWTGKLDQDAIDAKTADEVKIYKSDALPVASGNVTYHAVFAKEVSAAVEESDVINSTATSSDLNGKGTNWIDFSITGSTGSKYAIHSMGTSDGVALQWNSSGYLYCSQKPTSGAKLKSVSVTTTANKNIGVYGSANVYTAAATETSLGTLAATSSGATYNFTSTYYAIGLKGTTSSTSITSITITYGADAVYTDYITSCCEPLADIELNVEKTSSTATLTWTAIDGVTAWSVADIAGATKGDITTNDQGKKECEFTGLTSSTEYTFTVNATTIASGKCTDVISWSKVATTDASYTISVADIDSEVGSLVSIVGNTITVAPADGYRVKAGAAGFSVDGTANVTNNNDNTFTVTNLGSDVTITIIFEEIPTYAVNWYVNGVSQKEETYRDGTLVSTIMADAPAVTGNELATCGSTKFIGWVTAEYKANGGTVENYNAIKVNGEATLSAAANYYAMFVTSNGVENGFELVTSAPADWSGTYLIVNSDKGKAMTSNLSSGTFTTSDVTDNNGTIVCSEDACVWIIAAGSSNKYTVKSKNLSKFATIGGGSKTAGLSDEPTDLNISMDEGVVTIDNGDRAFAYYDNDFRTYSNSTTGYLYKSVPAEYADYRTGCECNAVSVTKNDVDNGTITLNSSEAVSVNVTTCTDNNVEVRIAPAATYQFAATDAVTFAVEGATGFTAPTTYTEDNGARVYTISIPKGTAAGTITVSASFESLPMFGIDLTGVEHLTNLASTPATQALGGATVTLSYDNVEEGYTFLNWIVKGATSKNAISVENNQFQMPNNEGVVVTADIRENVSVAFYVGTSPYGAAAVTYQGGKISLPATDPTESFDDTNYPYFIGWSATNFGATTEAPALVTGDETINASTSYYAVFADNDPAVMTNNYGKVTTIGDLANNCQYVIAAWDAAEQKHYAATGALTSNNYYLDKVDVTSKFAENVISAPANSEVWTAKVENEKVQFQNVDNSKYMSVVVSSNHTNFSLADNTGEAYAYAVSNGAWIFTTSSLSSNKQIEYFDDENKDYFSYYSGQDAPIYLYKQQGQAPTKWATKQMDEITVSFNDNVEEEEITVPGNQVVESGSDLDLSGFTPGARAGYQFAGWSLTTDGDVVTILNDITDNTPLYAIWTPNPICTIKFNVRGTVKETLNEVVLQGLEYTGFAGKTIAEEDNVEGYTFIGWAAAEQTTETTTALVPMTSFTPEVAEPAASSVKEVYAIFKRSTDAVEKVDHLERAFTGIGSGDGYGGWDSKEGSSGAVYAGNSAGGNNAIQMRSGSGSAIVTTTSAGQATKVALTWNSNTTAARTVDVYGKNTAYEDASSLYSAAGTKIGSIVYGTSTELTISDEYAFIGLRSNNGALYLNEIAITWVTSTSYYTTRPAQLWTVTYDLGEGGSWKANEGCDNGQVQEGEYTVCTYVPANSNENMLFMGWKIGNTPVTTETIDVTNDVTITAIWKEKTSVTVTYNAQGCEGDAPAVQNVKEGDVITVVSNPFTNAGYLFAGWDVYYMNETKQTIELDANNQFVMPAYNVTIAPTWSPKSDDKWTLVTNVDELVAATNGAPQYVIASYQASAGIYYAMGEQRQNNRGAVEVSVTNGTLYGPQAMAIFTLEDAGEGKFAIKAVADNKYLYAAGGDDNNYLRSRAENSNGDGKWVINVETSGEASIVASGDAARNNIFFNTSKFFSCYTATTETYKKSVALYRLVNKIEVDGEAVNASTILPSDPAEASDVVVRTGTTLTIDADRTVNDFTVETGATVVIPDGKTLTVKDNVYISATLGSSMSPSTAAGIVNAARMAVEENRDVFFDLTLPLNGTSTQWHAFTVPFPVDAANGIYDLDGNKLTAEWNYAIMSYRSDLRANGLYGWKKDYGILQPGMFYLMATDGHRTTYRLKKAEGALQANPVMTFLPYDGTSENDADKGWNAVGNPNMYNASVDKAVQVLDPVAYEYRPVPANSVISMGMPYFYKADHEGAAGSITTAYDAGSPFYAPARVVDTDIKNLAVNFGNATYRDVLYISANDEALNQYEYDKDLMKLRMSNTPRVAQIIGEAYGVQLSMANLPFVNEMAEVAVTLYVPATGMYTISADENVNATVYLVRDGAIIWNLSASEYTAEFEQGNTTGYSIRIAKVANATTGIGNAEVSESAQKVLLNNNIYILRNEQMYDMTGKAVK